MPTIRYVMFLIYIFFLQIKKSFGGYIFYNYLDLTAWIENIVVKPFMREIVKFILDIFVYSLRNTYTNEYKERSKFDSLDRDR